MKICSKCKIEKDESDFYKNRGQTSGLNPSCAACCKKQKADSYEVGLAYREKNKDKVNANSKKWREENKDRAYETQKVWLKNNLEKRKEYLIKYKKENKDRLRERDREYAVKYNAENVEKQKEYRKSKRNEVNKKRRDRTKNDPLYKLVQSLRSLTRFAFSRIKIDKPCGTEKLLGTNWQTAKEHIELQFKEGMCWQNHGEWHIDHKIPLASAKTEDELRLICHYTNLQPLWMVDNLRKKDKIL